MAEVRLLVADRESWWSLLMGSFRFSNWRQMWFNFWPINMIGSGNNFFLSWIGITEGKTNSISTTSFIRRNCRFKYSYSRFTVYSFHWSIFPGHNLTYIAFILIWHGRFFCIELWLKRCVQLVKIDKASLCWRVKKIKYILHDDCRYLPVSAFMSVYYALVFRYEVAGRSSLAQAISEEFRLVPYLQPWF